MKIHELEISDVRGIRHLSLKPAGENLVIWGPNGSGKSAVVDAIEFLLQGRISRLEGPGTAGINLATHGPHIDGNTATAVVKALIQIPGKKGIHEISRCMARPYDLVYPQEVKGEISVILDAASSGQYVLSRREILGFITSTGGDRSISIQKLLRLEELEEKRKLLVRSMNKAIGMERSKKSDIKNAYSVFARTAQLENFSEYRALKRVNELRLILGGEPIDTLDPDAVSSNLERTGPAARDVDSLTIIEMALELKELWPDAALELSSGSKILHEAVLELCGDSVLLDRLDRYDLIEAGINLIPPDGNCPLCESSWEKGKLEIKLRDDVSSLMSIAALREEIRLQAEVLKNKTADLNSYIETVISLAVSLGIMPVQSSLAVWDPPLCAYNIAMKGLLSRIDTNSPNTTIPPSLFGMNVDMKILDELVASARALNPEATPEQKASELLGRLSENLKTINRIESSLKQTSQLADRMKCLTNSFITASNEVLNELYESVKNRFVDLYKYLHAEDGEDKFSALLERQDSALQFEVDFFNRGMHPPQALHSEGHQDSMGICLYLALAEQVNHGLINLVVLDDVVMSVDSGHRKRLARLIEDNFKSIQFVITTHERAWAHQLKSEGLVTASCQVHLCDWSVECGPRQTEEDIWKKIEKCISTDDVRGASSYLRGYLEEFFAETCENLGGSVIYRGTGGYTLGDFLPSAWARYTGLMKKAKKSANSWGDDGTVNQLLETHSSAQSCFDSTTAEGWAVNKGIHYDEWVSLSAKDLKDVVSAFRNLCDVFTCAQCRRPLRVARIRMIPVKVQCPCGHVSWNLENK